jgi:protease YdgD
MNKLLAFALALLLCAAHVAAQQSPDDERGDGYESPQDKLKKMRPAEKPTDVITSFHRRVVDSTAYPWRAVGRLNINGVIHCSASLIGENIVLTAAHCLYSKRTGKMVPPTAVNFVAGYAKGEYVAHSRASRYTVSPGFNGGKGATQANIPYDWAIIILQDPIGAEHGFLDIHESLRPLTKAGARPRVELESHNIITAGYPGDRSHVLSLEENCKITSAQARGSVLITNCTAIKGDSGGPILQKPNDQWVLIGLNVASLRGLEKRASVGLSALAFRRAYGAVLRQLASEKDTSSSTASED